MLTHLEFEQLKRALDRLRSVKESSNYGNEGAINKGDVVEILLPYVDGFAAPNPHTHPNTDTNLP